MYLLAGILALIAVASNAYHELQAHDGSLMVTVINLIAIGGLCMPAWRAVRERRKYRRQREAAVARARESDTSLQTLLEQLPCSVVALDPSFTVRRVNRQVEKMTGFSAAEVLGRKCYAFFGSGRICDNCPVERALATGEVQQNVKQERTAAGQELFIEQTAIPMVGKGGEIRHVLEIVFDATRKVTLERENRDVFVQTVGALASLIDSRDTATGRHSVAVRDIALRIGRQLGLSPEVIEEISIAALLHDIGKIGVAEAILNKPGRLTEEEYAVIRRHPEIGYNTLAVVKPLAKIAGYILSHHERFDGTGYPHGQKGEEIPLVARILCVADVYEAITADRVYRPAISVPEAVRIMHAGRGTMFDPAVLDAFFADLGRSNGEAADAIASLAALPGEKPGSGRGDAAH
ncbi:HD domain-containing phosphohydrolase [Anaeroselena agilis]|uniref:HD domain-containing phosphohydrolase n=1 Tax=Anaeroselena agilis TaxID=3063788 RepID=A0ABU3P106_9FIRM|nr:HD domain-containing phosphohydrolase [Selenomonadales bacterium 4137-cl]